jgi:hypothetical protein
MRIGSLFWAKTRLGAAMLAIPAPATLPTNCRRDIVMDPPGNTVIEVSACYFFRWAIYRTEVINDQVITTRSAWRAGYFGGLV